MHTVVLLLILVGVSLSYCQPCNNPSTSCTLFPHGTTTGYHSLPTLIFVTPFCNEINVSISVASEPHVSYSIGYFTFGVTDINTLSSNYYIYNGFCDGHCDDHITTDNPDFYIVTIGPSNCSPCSPPNGNNCCPVTFSFSITYGLYPADSY